MTVQINLYAKKAYDPFGWAIQALEGDCPVSHATMVINGHEFTTGALPGVRYGEVDPDAYHVGRKIYVCEFIIPPTLEEEAKLYDSCMSLWGMPYGYQTLAMLVSANMRGDFIQKLGDVPKLMPTNPICSEAVVHHVWQINRPLAQNQYFKKLEARACTPATLWNAANHGDTISIVDICEK